MFDRLGIFEDSALAMLGIDNWRFHAPILIGDTIHMEMEITGRRLTSRGDRGIIDRLIRLVRHDGTLLQAGRMGLMIRLRPEG